MLSRTATSAARPGAPLHSTRNRLRRHLDIDCLSTDRLPDMTRTVKTQKGLFIRAGDHTVSEVPIPCPPPDHNAIQPPVYATLLKASDAGRFHLTASCISPTPLQRVTAAAAAAADA